MIRYVSYCTDFANAAFVVDGCEGRVRGLGGSDEVRKRKWRHGPHQEILVALRGRTVTPPPFRFDDLTWTVLDDRSGVYADWRWHRDDVANVPRLDGDTFGRIRDACAWGARHLRAGRHREAHNAFQQVLGWVPSPQVRWNATGYALLALGQVHVCTHRWSSARDILCDAMPCPGVYGNPWAHRLKGVVHFELGQLSQAREELFRAYAGASRICSCAGRPARARPSRSTTPALCKDFLETKPVPSPGTAKRLSLQGPEHGWLNAALSCGDKEHMCDAFETLSRGN